MPGVQFAEVATVFKAAEFRARVPDVGLSMRTPHGGDQDELMVVFSGGYADWKPVPSPDAPELKKRPELKHGLFFAFSRLSNAEEVLAFAREWGPLGETKALKSNHEKVERLMAQFQPVPADQLKYWANGELVQDWLKHAARMEVAKNFWIALNESRKVVCTGLVPPLEELVRWEGKRVEVRWGRRVEEHDGGDWMLLWDGTRLDDRPPIRPMARGCPALNLLPPSSLLLAEAVELGLSPLAPCAVLPQAVALGLPPAMFLDSYIQIGPQPREVDFMENLTGRRIAFTPGDLVGPGQEFLANLVTWGMRDARTSLEWIDGKPTLQTRPMNLLSALWMQLASAISGQKDAGICRICGEQYLPRLRGRGKNNQYCEKRACKWLGSPARARRMKAKEVQHGQEGR